MRFGHAHLERGLSPGRWEMGLTWDLFNRIVNLCKLALAPIPPRDNLES